MQLQTFYLSFRVIDLFWLTPRCGPSAKLNLQASGYCPTGMEIERLVHLGKELDLKGEELREFVKGEQV